MNIRATIDDDIVILDLSGHMDLEHIRDLDKIFNQYYEEGYRKFVLVMLDVKDISSSGIGRILSLFKKLELVNGRLALAELSAVSEYVLDLARLKDIFPIYKNRQDAIDSMPKKS